MATRLYALVFLFWLLPSLSLAGETRDPYQYFFEASLGDLTEELEIARDEGKQGIFVFFEMDECPFCHRMKQTVLNQPEVQEYFGERFHSLAIDIEGDIEIVDFDGKDMTQKEFASQYRVRATPLQRELELEVDSARRRRPGAVQSRRTIPLSAHPCRDRRILCGGGRPACLHPRVRTRAAKP